MGLWRQNDRLAKTSRLYDRANENGVGANTMTRLPSRTPQSDHHESQIPMRSLPKHCACAAKRHVEFREATIRARGQRKQPLPIHQRHASTTNPNGTRLSPHRGRLRTVADGCGRKQLLANTPSTPRPPLINGNPSLRIREKEGCCPVGMVQASGSFLTADFEP